MNANGVLGAGPGKYRVGVLALANDQVIERDLARLLPGDILTCTTRIAFDGDCTLERLAEMAPLIAAATRLLHPEAPLAAVVFGCTSGTVAIGAGNINAAIHSAAPGVPVFDPLHAACAALAHLGARRLHLLTPYQPALAEQMAHWLGERGLQTARRFDFGITDSADISRITPQAILAAARRLPAGEADAIFLPCTDLQSLPVLDEIQAATGLPALSSNSALAWMLLRRLNVPGRLPGLRPPTAAPPTATPTRRQEHATLP